MSSMKLFYWGIKARGYAPAVIAQAGGIPLEIDNNPGFKFIIYDISVQFHSNLIS